MSEPMIVATADGCGTAEIMRRSGLSKPVVWRWQERFMQQGVDGLLRDKTRKPGKPPLPAETVQRVLDLTLFGPTGETMHWSVRAMAKAAGTYVLPLTANQPALLDDVRLLLSDPQAPPDSQAETVDGDHGRIETRRAAVLSDVSNLAREQAFPGLAAIAKIEATREVGGRIATATRYFLWSKPISAKTLLHVVRAHWGIENSLHWVLDVVFDEDQASQSMRPRTRKPQPASEVRPQSASRKPSQGLSTPEIQTRRMA